MTLKKLHDIIIYSDPRFHSAMPSVITRPDSEIIVAFRRAPDRRRVGIPAVSHVDPNSQLVCVRSHDGGSSWSDEPELICAHPLYGCQDPCLLQQTDGPLLCTSYGWMLVGREFASERDDCCRAGNFISNGGFLVRSHDGGTTWTSPVEAPRVPHNTARDTEGNPLPLFNRGALAQDDAGRIYWAVTVHRRMGPPHGAIELLTSDDGGVHWDHRCVVAESERVSFNESALYFTPGSDLLCFIRTFGFDDHTVVARSTDGGASFEKWRDTGWQGHPHHAQRLPDGRALLVYGYRHQPVGIRVRVLEPEYGDIATAPEQILRNNGGNWDIGYPWSTLLPDGNVLVVYYFNEADGVRHIAGTLLKPL